MEFEDKQIFYVSSKDRSTGSSSNFLYNFQLSSDTNYDSVVVLAASIPKSYYLISTTNDEFILTEDNVSINIHIPDGNYTLSSWKTILTAALNAASPNNWTYTMTYPTTKETNTGKFTFTVSGNGLIQPSFTFGEYLYEQMGFEQNTYSFSNNTLTSVNVINLQLLNAVFISSDICNNKHDTVLQEIYSNNSDYSFLTYQSTAVTAYSKKISVKGNSVYRFFLTNAYGDIVDLNGLNWNFTLMFYKENKTMDMIKNFIKFSLMQ